MRLWSQLMPPVLLIAVSQTAQGSMTRATYATFFSSHLHMAQTQQQAQAQLKDPKVSMEEINNVMLRFVSTSNNLAGLFNRAARSVADAKAVSADIAKAEQDLTNLNNEMTQVIQTTNANDPEAARFVELAIQSYGAYIEVVGKARIAAGPNIMAMQTEAAQQAQPTQPAQ